MPYTRKTSVKKSDDSPEEATEEGCRTETFNNTPTQWIFLLNGKEM